MALEGSRVRFGVIILIHFAVWSLLSSFAAGASWTQENRWRDNVNDVGMVDDDNYAGQYVALEDLPTLPTPLPVYQTTASLLLMDNNLKGLRDLPELSKEEASMMENMKTISPADKLYKHLIKNNKFQPGMRDTQSKKKFKSYDIKESYAVPIYSQRRVISRDEGKDPEKEIEIEFSGVDNADMKAKQTHFSTPQNSEKMHEYFENDSVEDTRGNLDKDQSNENQGKQDYSHSASRRNIFDDDGDYSVPDYFEFGDNVSEEVPQKTEEGNESITLAKRDTRKKKKVPTATLR